MRRRTLLSVPLGLLASPVASLATEVEADVSDAFERRELSIESSAHLPRRAVLLVPKHLSPRTIRRALVLLHGLGETGSERLGLAAWPRLYGLLSNYNRLRNPPVRRISNHDPYLSEARAAELNRSLADRPFRGFALVCPVTPNPARFAARDRAIDAYTEWLEDGLLPLMRAELKTLPELAIGLDGCSLGGYLALEVLLRRPDRFDSFGVVQSAIGVRAALDYARRIAAVRRTPAKPIHIETSTQDPFRAANECLADELSALGVANEKQVIDGPHSQPWLRAIGTLEMLLFHDRNLGDSA
jgi:pimeloyl-ACP methyl ester carboxylesterase